MAEPRAAEKKLLEMRGISKSFGRFKALDKVDFTLREGEIHALLGENGAGKSTLIKIMTGALGTDSGEVMFAGKPVRLRSPHHAQECGISCVYQEVNLLPNLSVAENVTLGRVPKRFGCIDWSAVRKQAREALQILNLDIDVRLPLQSYSIAIQQLVAIARAVAIDAKVLVLDEPTSSLDEAEVETLFGVMRRLRDQGIGIVFITHFLDQVDAIADRITVLRNGLLVGEFDASQLSRVELISKMVGKELADSEMRCNTEEAAQRPPLLEVRELKRRRVGPLNLFVRAGETVGFAGLLGSGRTETARMLFGLDRPEEGEIVLGDATQRFRSPRYAMRGGIGFLPEDRKTEAVIPSLSVSENITLALQAKRGWFRRIRSSRRQELGEKFRAALSIATDSLDKPVSQLSGGNQQKVILARWLATEPRLLILDEPTRGIDVGARAEIERLIASLCQDGIGVLMISSEIDELLRCADRLVVLKDGKISGELPRGSTSDQVMHLLAGEET